MKKLPVLMTASVSTHGMKGACFSDEQRESMYVGALSYYIENLLVDKNQKIVFAENSGWNIDSIKNKLPEYDSQQIEFVSVPYDLFDISKGKGYNELLLINKTVAQSKFIKEAGGFFKVTGRYPIYNLGYFVKRASEKMFGGKVKMYADIKDHKLYDWLRLGWCGHSFECRMFGVENDYYLANIAPLYSQCNDYDDKLLEAVLFDYVKGEDRDKVSLRFRREPHFGGMEGSEVQAVSFSKNQDSFKGKLKRYVGNGIRIFLPFFYF